MRQVEMRLKFMGHSRKLEGRGPHSLGKMGTPGPYFHGVPKIWSLVVVSLKIGKQY